MGRSSTKRTTSPAKTRRGKLWRKQKRVQKTEENQNTSGATNTFYAPKQPKMPLMWELETHLSRAPIRDTLVSGFSLTFKPATDRLRPRTQKWPGQHLVPSHLRGFEARDRRDRRDRRARGRREAPRPSGPAGRRTAPSGRSHRRRRPKAPPRMERSSLSSPKTLELSDVASRLSC